MPCVPIGMTVTRGRTSRLNRFLSMPRYDGASRSRRRRGLLTHGLTVEVHDTDPSTSDVVRARVDLSSAMWASSRAGLLTPAPVTGPAAASQRKAHLAARDSDLSRSACRVAALETDAVGQPTGDVASQPPDSAAVEAPSSRKAPEQRQRREHPPMPPREARDVMRGQELLKRGRSFIHPLRE